MNESINELIQVLNIPSEHSSGDHSLTDNKVLLSKLLSYASEELNKFYGLDTKISEIEDESEVMSLYIEISGFLREFGCPYTTLLEGSLENRFESEIAINLILRYLLSEVMAAKVNAVEHHDCPCLAKAHVETFDNANNLTAIVMSPLMLLGVGKPPDNMTTELFFEKFEKSLKEKLPSIPKYYLGTSLMSLTKPLTEEQWRKVDFIINSLNDDHHSRRQTLIQRFDVTIQSLKWSPKAPRVMDEIIKSYSAARTEMDTKTLITLVDLLAARDYPLALIVKTCSSDAREKSKCKLNRLVIGPVNDRGGRPFEMEAPPPEVPAFQKRDSSGQQSNRGGRGGFQNQGGDIGGFQNQRGNRGGFQNQGGYQDKGGYQDRGFHGQDRGGYSGQDRGSYHGDNRGRMMAQNYRDQPVDMYAQSVAPNNFYSHNDSYNYTPQYQSQGYRPSDRNDGRRNQRY